MRYELIQIDDDGRRTRTLASGAARDCLVAAARECDSLTLGDLRLYTLPHVQRQIAACERNTGQGHLAASPESLPDRPVFATAPRPAETYQPHAG